MNKPSPIQVHVEIPSHPRAVFEALTRSTALEGWFSERADVSQPDERYDFWGRFTPEAPDRSGGVHRVLSWSPDAALSYGWHIRGTDTIVAIALEATAAGTRLGLTHDAPERAEGELSLADFWMLSLENLRRYLRDGAAPIRRDYTSASGNVVELALDIEAPPDRVFQGLTDPELLEKWMNARAAEVDARVGGTYRYWEGQGPIEILDLVPDERLSCRWAYGADTETIVTWTLAGSGGRTRLTLVHSGFGRDVEDFRTGWLKHLVFLKELLERGSGFEQPVLLTTDCGA